MLDTVIRATLTCLLLSLSTYAIIYSDCGTSNGTTIWNVQLLGCEHLETCELHRGKRAILDVKFKPTSNSNQTKMLMHGKISGLFIPFNFKQKDACYQNSGLKCPLEAKNYTYHAEVDVKRSYPPLAVDMRFKLVDVGSKEVLFCILIPSKIV